MTGLEIERRRNDQALSVRAVVYCSGARFQRRFGALSGGAGLCGLAAQERATRGGAKAIFQSCVKGIEWADAVVACMDGPDPDSGTSWEVGFAYAQEKPIICYRSDFRTAGDTKGTPYNLMLSEAATARVELTPKATAADLHRRVLTEIRKALR